MDALEGLTNFIHTDNFKRTLQTKNYQITIEMLDFMLNYDPYRNRLAKFLTGIDLNKLEGKKLTDVRRLWVRLNFYMTNRAKNTKEFFYYLIIHMINDEILFITCPPKADKKYYDDIKRLNKLQQQIIERYYFKDDILSYFEKIGVDFGIKGDFKTIIGICSLIGEALRFGYYLKDDKEKALRIINDIFIKKYDKLPTLKELTKGTLNIDNIIHLIPLLYGFTSTAAQLENKFSLETATSDALVTINNFFSLSIKYEIGRNEFQNAVKEIYQAYTKHFSQ